jgi:hypothetical protein
VGLPENRISYGIGTAAWDAKAQQEGLPLFDHVEPEPITDSASSPQAAHAERFAHGQDCKIGGLYYVAALPMLFSPAHSILMLDKFFENATPGGTPYYDRVYDAEDIRSDPANPFINFWKKTSRPGLDHNLCCNNGIVTGIELAKEPGQTVKLTARCAFGDRSLAEADPGLWTVDRTHGNYAPVAEGSIVFAVGTPGGTYATYLVHTFHLNLSCEFTPHFWGSQKPDRFSRGKVALSGDITLRDITDQVETFVGWLEGSTVKTGGISLGSYSTVLFNMQIMSGGGVEDETTRQGRFGFTGVYEPTSAYPTGLRWTVRAGRAYTP